MRQMPPVANDVGIDAVGHCHLGHRHAGLAAFGQHLRLLQLAVSSPCLLVASHASTYVTWTASLSQVTAGSR